MTGITYEPWHWRYVGVENAAKINARAACALRTISPLCSSIAAERQTTGEETVKIFRLPFAIRALIW